MAKERQLWFNKKCVDCGTEIEHVGRSTIRCKSCQKKRNRRRMKIWHKNINEKTKKIMAALPEHTSVFGKISSVQITVAGEYLLKGSPQKIEKDFIILNQSFELVTTKLVEFLSAEFGDVSNHRGDVHRSFLFRLMKQGHRSKEKPVSEEISEPNPEKKRLYRFTAKKLGDIFGERIVLTTTRKLMATIQKAEVDPVTNKRVWKMASLDGKTTVQLPLNYKYLQEKLTSGKYNIRVVDTKLIRNCFGSIRVDIEQL